jgi:phenylalanyl-tRNA synthetase alpha chain
MLERLDGLEEAAMKQLQEADDQAELEAWKVKFLGRSAELGEILDALRELPKADRPSVGKRANQLKSALEKAYESHRSAFRATALDEKLRAEQIDVTLPGRKPVNGRLHPVTQITRQILSIWAEMGFQVYLSREVETDEYNFGLLNFPPHHPARDMQDSFYMAESNVLLRTHTSPGQIHVMRERSPETIRVVLPGMCYRYEQVTARSEIQFTQIEGLAVGHNITFADLKGTLSAFARRMFGQQARSRFRAAYFPFTEPSAEVDIECFVCGGEGCPVCRRTGWLEILGCGMVHPTVLENGGYDPDEFTGFAFGMGPERIAMLKHGIEDIRYFWQNDLRFLEQF